MIVLLVILIYILYKLKLSYRLRVSKQEFFFRIIFLVTFFIFFVVIFRFMNLFRNTSIVDLKVIIFKLKEYNIIVLILGILLMILLIKIIIHEFKFSFLKVHYYLMNIINFRFCKLYCNIIYRIINWHNRVLLFLYIKDFYFFENNKNIVYYFFKYGFTLIILMIFVLDIVLNNLVLNNFLKILPWYSLYKLLYDMNYFLIYKMEFMYDAVITEILYPENWSLEYRLHYEFEPHDFFSMKAPKDYDKFNDDFLVLRTYIKNQIL